MQKLEPVFLLRDQKPCDLDFEEGVVVAINKPAGITSAGVVGRIRRLIKLKRVGHAGTLDPAATGLLIVLTGRATKLQNHFLELEKEYLATVLFGVETTTWDLEGEIIKQNLAAERSPEEITCLLAQHFTGDILQTPPAYSAIKTNGVPAYRRARSGQEVTLEARRVKVHSISLENWAWPEVTLRICCSKGFYVRSLAHDLGAIVSCGGVLKQLVRTRIGPHRLEEALSLDDLKALLKPE
ncbi:MAG: tRNA pseudouridine(55) synthase TruB [bacterium]